MPTRPSYKPEQVIQNINSLYEENASLTYEQLMQRYKKLVMWTKWKLRDDKEVQDKLKEILRSSVILSVKEAARKEPIDFVYVQDKHWGWIKNANWIYSKDNGKCPWRLLVEDAGLKYPCRTHEEWTLKKVLERISWLDDDISVKQAKKIFPKLFKAAEYIAGGQGKAMILAGKNILQRPRLKKSYYTFSISELFKIWGNNSLNYEDKINCIFNALAFQYYDWQNSEKSKSRIWRSVNGERKLNLMICQKDLYFQGRLETLLEQSQNLNGLFSVSMNLKNKNRLARYANFYFLGKKAGLEAGEFYDKLNNKLGKF